MELKLEPFSQPAPLGSDKQRVAPATATCPKCKYQRRAADTAPDWQCPSCGVAYAKVAPASASPSSNQRRASAQPDDDEDTPVVAKRSPLGTARVVVALLLLAMVVGVGWSWLAKRNAKNLQAEQALAAQRQQAIDQASGQLLTNKRLTDATALYQSGRFDQALVALRPLADQGNAQAMMLTGVMLTWGHSGAPKDPELGQQWLQKAANPMAWTWLGYFAEQQGKNSGQMDASVNYYRRAAQAGNAAGLYGLARLVQSGLGVAKDPARAYSLYALAAKAFNDDVRASELAPRDGTGLGSAAAMMELKSQLSPVDIVRSEELAKTWQPGNPLP